MTLDKDDEIKELRGLHCFLVPTAIWNCNMESWWNFLLQVSKVCFEIYKFERIKKRDEILSNYLKVCSSYNNLFTNSSEYLSWTQSVLVQGRSTGGWIRQREDTQRNLGLLSLEDSNAGSCRSGRVEMHRHQWFRTEHHFLFLETERAETLQETQVSWGTQSCALRRWRC